MVGARARSLSFRAPKATPSKTAMLTLKIVLDVALYFRVTEKQVLEYMVLHHEVLPPAEFARNQKQYDSDMGRDSV